MEVVGERTPVDSGGGSGASDNPAVQTERKRSPVAYTSSKPMKQGGGSKDHGSSLRTSVNRSLSQIRKHTRRSPVNWFPRKKGDSYLQRKIRHLQEVAGMNSSLDETLEGANLHYSKIAREKIAARQAAEKAMEARKAAMVEASWCRMLNAARIHSKEAETELERAEQQVSEAFEAAASMGVMMYDRPDCQKWPSDVQTSLGHGGTSTHTITATFETAFEVDRQVAEAVKNAFVKLASCPLSSNKEDLRHLVRKMNPSEPELESTDKVLIATVETESFDRDFGQRLLHKEGSEPLYSKNKGDLGDVMFQRLKCLQDDQLASLAVIVATRGLNAALSETDSKRDEDSSSLSARPAIADASLEKTPLSVRDRSRRYSIQTLMQGTLKKKEITREIFSINNDLVKHVRKLQNELPVGPQNESADSCSGNVEKSMDKNDVTVSLDGATDSHPHLLLDEHLDKENENVNVNMKLLQNTSEKKLQSPPVAVQKHMSRIERAKQEALQAFIVQGEQVGLDTFLGKPVKRSDNTKKEAAEQRTKFIPKERRQQTHESKVNPTESLDKILVKHVSRLERIKNEAQSGKFTEKKSQGKPEPKTSAFESLDSILVKHVSRFDKLRMEATERVEEYAKKGEPKEGNLAVNNSESLDKILVKHVSRLEKEKLAALQLNEKGSVLEPTMKNDQPQLDNRFQSLDEVLVKHQSGLEKAKSTASQQSDVAPKSAARRKESREKELLEAWGGLSLGNAVKPSSSRSSSQGTGKAKLAEVEKADIATKHAGSWKQQREKELQEAWGGLSLENSVKPSLSRLEREKAAWREAEEEERRRANQI